MRLCRCPFCRSKDVKLMAVSPRHAPRVHCLACGAAGPIDNSPHDTAAELWNDQAGPWGHIIKAALSSAVVLAVATIAHTLGVLQ